MATTHDTHDCAQLECRRHKGWGLPVMEMTTAAATSVTNCSWTNCSTREKKSCVEKKPLPFMSSMTEFHFIPIMLFKFCSQKDPSRKLELEEAAASLGECGIVNIYSGN